MSVRSYSEPIERLEGIMNPFESLKKDHQKVAVLLQKLEETTDRGIKTREELFGKLKTALDVHAHIEEAILYPALLKRKETEKITREALEEHKGAKMLLQELHTLPKDDAQWGAKLSVLKENVEHHVKEEEGEMFMKAQKILKKEEAEELGDKMEAEKERFLRSAMRSSNQVALH